MPKKQKETNGRQERIPLRITDTTLRDAHQSLWATRMRTEDMLKIIDVIDKVGFYSLEMWGGATFDVCLRFLRENPWERLRAIKAKTKTPLQMLLRGQNILGYKNYPDDLLERFIALAVKNGIDIFRIFDALNDNRNLDHAIRMVKKYGAHAQGTLCYTISPVHTVEEYVRVAREQVEIGIDSLCIKDMAGILSPIATEKLVTALIDEIDAPIQLHCHATSGMAIPSYVEGVRAGAGAIDCAISPMAGFSSQPPVETMLSIFEDMPYHAKLDPDALKEMCKYFLELKKEIGFKHQEMNVIDPEILSHHIPGGMISNLKSQLQQQDALDRLNEVFEELPRVRADLGYPPLVTPTSQIVGIQSVLNVLSGERYSLVPQETKDYVKGLYGKPPAPIDQEVARKILGDEKPVVCRPADLLSPALPSATDGADPKLIHNEEDILSYCLFPEPALEFFKWRALPPDQRSPIPADEERKKVKETEPQEPPTAVPQPLLPYDDYQAIHDLLKKLPKVTELTITKDDISVTVKTNGEGSTTVTTPTTTEQTAPAQPHEATATTLTVDTQQVQTPPPAESVPAAAEPPPAKEPEAATKQESGSTINAPLNGTFYVTPGPGKPKFVKIGDEVKAGTTVCVIEAMKLFNEIKAPADCKVTKMLVEHGQAVTKDQALFAIEKS